MNDGQVLEIAQQVFDRYNHGAQTGDWTSLLNMMIEDYTMVYPVPGEFWGKHQGRERVQAYFDNLSANAQLKMSLTNPINLTQEGFVMEFEVAGTAAGQPFQTTVAQFYQVRGDKIAGHREYLGDIAPFIAMAQQ